MSLPPPDTVVSNAAPPDSINSVPPLSTVSPLSVVPDETLWGEPELTVTPPTVTVISVPLTPALVIANASLAKLPAGP